MREIFVGLKIIAMKAIETSGLIDEQGHLILPEKITMTAPGRVRVIVLAPDSDSPNEIEWLKAASGNEAFNFLKDPEEDIYTINDGKPFYEA